MWRGAGGSRGGHEGNASRDDIPVKRLPLLKKQAKRPARGRSERSGCYLLINTPSGRDLRPSGRRACQLAKHIHGDPPVCYCQKIQQSHDTPWSVLKRHSRL